MLTVGGWDDNFVRLASAGQSGQAAAYVSDQVLAPWTGVAEFAFDFRSNTPDSGDGADGWGWALLNTADWGATGSTGSGFDPEPDYSGSLGVGLDTSDNGSEGPNSVSVHFAGVELTSVPLTSSASATPLETGHVLRAAIKLRPVTGGSEVTIRVLDLETNELLEPITDFFVAGLFPYEARVQIGASTSGVRA